MTVWVVQTGPDLNSWNESDSSILSIHNSEEGALKACQDFMQQRKNVEWKLNVKGCWIGGDEYIQLEEWEVE